jgi:hypothetical protein
MGYSMFLLLLLLLLSLLLLLLMMMMMKMIMTVIMCLQQWLSDVFVTFVFKFPYGMITRIW